MPVCFCTYEVKGNNEKYNTILYREPIAIKNGYGSKYIVFFPGDYSNFFTNSIYTSFKLESKYNCTNYCYSYEALFWVTSQKYIYDHIIFITPTHFYKYYATFSNFLNPNEVSSNKNFENISKENKPEKIETDTNNNNVTMKGVKHLLCLLIALNKKLLDNKKENMKSSINSNVDSINTIVGYQNDLHQINSSDTTYNSDNSKKINEEKKTNNETFINENIRDIYVKETIKKKLVLIGFSKGCTVLLSLLRETNDMSFFWTNIDSLIFLDPGFNKNSFNYSIGKNSLEKISEYNFKIFIHSSPFCMAVKNGECVNKGLLNFVKILRKSNISVSSYLHYVNYHSSINPLSLHFEILLDFFGEILPETNTESSKLNVHEGVEKTFCEYNKCKDSFLFENWIKGSLIKGII